MTHLLEALTIEALRIARRWELDRPSARDSGLTLALSPAVTAALPPRFGFVIKREITKVPLVGWMLTRLGSEFVERFDQSGARNDAGRTAKSPGQITADVALRLQPMQAVDMPCAVGPEPIGCDSVTESSLDLSLRPRQSATIPRRNRFAAHNFRRRDS